MMKLSKRQKQELFGKTISLVFVISLLIGLLAILVSHSKGIEQRKQQQLNDRPWSEDFEDVDSVNFIDN